MLFCKAHQRDFFVDEVLILNSFGTVEEYCQDNFCFYELCRVALIMGKRDKFNQYFSEVRNTEERKKLNLLSA